MKNLFEASTAHDIKARVSRLRPDSERQWGKMTPPQMLAHCSTAFEMAMGEIKPPRAFIGRVLGGIVKPLALKDETPLRRNAPTTRELIVADRRDLEMERARLSAMVDRFTAGGPATCTDHPHAFFGRLKPEEWAVLMYKHLDHHLRQFGV